MDDSDNMIFKGRIPPCSALLADLQPPLVALRLTIIGNGNGIHTSLPLSPTLTAIACRWSTRAITSKNLLYKNGTNPS